VSVNKVECFSWWFWLKNCRLILKLFNTCKFLDYLKLSTLTIKATTTILSVKFNLTAHINVVKCIDSLKNFALFMNKNRHLHEHMLTFEPKTKCIYKNWFPLRAQDIDISLCRTHEESHLCDVNEILLTF
jgi:hypothetical protein